MAVKRCGATAHGYAENALGSRTIPDRRRHGGVIRQQWRPGRRERRYVYRLRRVSVQRLCFGGWTAALTKRLHSDCPHQNPMGDDNYIADTNRVVGLLDA